MLDGYKTKLAGIGGLLLGLSMVAASLGTGAVHGQDILNGVLVALGGLATLGVGGKLQKFIDAVKSIGTTQQTPPAS